MSNVREYLFLQGLWVGLLGLAILLGVAYLLSRRGNDDDD